MLLPILKKQIDSTQLAGSDEQLSEVASLTLESFDKSSTKELSDEDSQTWPVLLSALRHYHNLGKC